MIINNRLYILKTDLTHYIIFIAVLVTFEYEALL